MAAVSDTALAHHHNDALSSAARPLSAVPSRANRELAAFELRQAFAAQLKAARERRGISLQTISEITKVSETFFYDLERCDVSRWPKGIYRRAFFRGYASLIGMPGEATVSEFIRLFPENKQGTPDTLVPGPLRLTLARPFWQHISPIHAVAACLDVAAILLVSLIVAQLTNISLWATVALVALSYHLAGTAVRGCSPGMWWLRSRGRFMRSRALWLVLLLVASAAPAWAQQAQQGTFQPQVGQAGKDVVWVPTPEAMVEKMLDVAKVTPRDFVMDLGSGDGRNVIGAARRGAQGLGVEYNPDMVDLSKRLAKEAGVADKAQFVQGDMFEADITKADVLALFLLPSNLLRLRDKFLDLRPGSRIVSNTFSIQDWNADETVMLEPCEQWCTAMLYIVPAKVGGTWRMGSDVLDLKQSFQMLSGTFTASGQKPVEVSGSLRGSELNLKVGARTITARVDGNRLDGTVKDGEKTAPWRANR